LKIKKFAHSLIKAYHNQQGIAMIMALTSLALGALLIAPTLNYMAIGIKNINIHQKRTSEFYAADAGIEDGIWRMKNEPLIYPYSYELSDINNMSVNITMENYNYEIYKITSIANGTTVEAYTMPNCLYYPGGQNFDKNTVLVGNVYIDGNAIIGQHSEIYGDLYVVGDLQLDQADIVSGNIFATGDITMDQIVENLEVNGWIFSGGNLMISKNVVVHGSIYAMGSIQIDQNVVIEGSANAGGIVSWNPAKVDIQGEINEGYSGPWPDPFSWLNDPHKIISYQITREKIP